MGVVHEIGRLTHRHRKLSLQILYPPRRARNGTPVKGRWGIELTPPLIEKLSLQVLYPPGIELTTPLIEKLSLQVLYPLRGGEERDSGLRTMGYRVNDTVDRKIIAAGPIPPGPARKRDSD
jgi:hypothetical protein